MAPVEETVAFIANNGGDASVANSCEGARRTVNHVRKRRKLRQGESPCSYGEDDEDDDDDDDEDEDQPLQMRSMTPRARISELSGTGGLSPRQLADASRGRSSFRQGSDVDATTSSRDERPSHGSVRSAGEGSATPRHGRKEADKDVDGVKAEAGNDGEAEVTPPATMGAYCSREASLQAQVTRMLAWHDGLMLWKFLSLSFMV